MIGLDLSHCFAWPSRVELLIDFALFSMLSFGVGVGVGFALLGGECQVAERSGVEWNGVEWNWRIRWGKVEERGR